MIRVFILRNTIDIFLFWQLNTSNLTTTTNDTVQALYHTSFCWIFSLTSQTFHYSWIQLTRVTSVINTRFVSYVNYHSSHRTHVTMFLCG